MNPIKLLSFIFISICFSFSASAQTAKPAVKKTVVKKNGTVTTVAKFKPPVVKTFLGRNEKEVSVTIDEANQLVNLPLRIVDEANNVYTISSYQFMYKKKSVIEDEQNGKRQSVFTTTADLFRSTPLPKVWKENISGGLQKGEELLFFDIVVNDKQNRKFFAPNVKIIVK